MHIVTEKALPKRLARDVPVPSLAKCAAGSIQYLVRHYTTPVYAFNSVGSGGETPGGGP